MEVGEINGHLCHLRRRGGGRGALRECSGLRGELGSSTSPAMSAAPRIWSSRLRLLNAGGVALACGDALAVRMGFLLLEVEVACRDALQAGLSGPELSTRASATAVSRALRRCSGPLSASLAEGPV